MAKLGPVPSLEASVSTVVERLLRASPQKALELIELVGAQVSALSAQEGCVCVRESFGGGRKWGATLSISL